ncbi:metalloregulator ArsR/SmtB family transcription factor [bacterium]|nr:metalloregulator ArsR/SmtB family transcription factor [Candidatus Omnitrophota bacterium]MBU2527939.1 metalloregulator ArsR/SmtB family transcription factor [bacterium]MBU3929293.1 metalloregulator ArsR/SmtB family transcription factor [bacterium]MBU4122282.1 metalloregulator ArsR/SmtB family transcription factor [bacterium]
MRKETKLFKALSDETRLRIMLLLIHGELCVCDLVKVLDTTQSKISRHLYYLKNVGLVEDRREGLWIHYSIKEAETTLDKNLRMCLKQCFSDNGTMISDFKRLKKRLKEKSKC